MRVVTKTDYLLWRECPKNAWLRLHKPDIFDSFPLTEFDEAIIESGIEVEQVARGLFPGGVLIRPTDAEPRGATRAQLAAGVDVLFQPVFEVDRCLAAIDVLQRNSSTGAHSVFEIKSSSRLKEEHLYDVAFQALLIARKRLNIDQMFVIHLNREYVRRGALDLRGLFTFVEVGRSVREIATTVEREVAEAVPYLLKETEPSGPCSCIYKGRSAHCTTFRYSNPGVPEYGVHDIARIGNSPSKLREMVDAGIFTLDRIPAHIPLSEIQRAQVTAYQSGVAAIHKEGIKGELARLEYPLHFIDYETYPSAIPAFDGFAPHDHIPLQYSLHLLEATDGEPNHREYVHRSVQDPSQPFADALRHDVGQRGSVIVWNRRFEVGVNEKLAHRVPRVSEFIAGMNDRVYDLMDVFSKQYYVRREFLGKVSLKNVLPALVPEMTYSGLGIREGGTASVAWKRILFREFDDEERDKVLGQLSAYCERDSYAMYAIWRALRGLIGLR